MAETKISNLVNPQVMADGISAKIDKKLAVLPYAKIDDTLMGQAGNTVTVPKYAYIGDAEDVAEGVACGTTVLTATTTTATIKKGMKAIELTDEAILSGYGEPLSEAENQLAKSVVAKIDNDAFDGISDTTVSGRLISDTSASTISYANIVDAIALLNEEVNSTKVMYVNPLQVATLRKDSNFISADKYGVGMNVVMNGEIGAICNARIVPSKKVRLSQYEKDNSNGTITIVADATAEDSTHKHLSTIQPICADKLIVTDKVKALGSNAQFYINPIIKLNNDEETEEDTPAVTVYRKRDVNVEVERDTLKRTTIVSADALYTAVVSNDEKVVIAYNKK